MDDITYKDAFIIGSFQAAAIFPAISRSGMTIVAALWRKLDRETAAYFSFFIINASYCRSYHFAICRCFSRESRIYF
ncbi:undecaprenyl-diphosphate phosphatase [Bacillus cereus]